MKGDIMTTNRAEELLNTIRKSVKDNESIGVGLRGLYKGEKGNLNPSYVWEDGERTNIKLPGTSVVGITGDWASEDYESLIPKIETALKVVEGYGNTNDIGIVIGKLNTSGLNNDPGELLLENARVLDRIPKVKIVNNTLSTTQATANSSSTHEIKQTPLGQRVDQSITAKTIFPDTEEGRAQWHKNKNQGDMRGIDTRRTRITPKRPRIGR